jgi:hypothetical protein
MRNCTVNRELYSYEEEIHQKVLCKIWQVFWSKEEPETATISWTGEYAV